MHKTIQLKDLSIGYTEKGTGKKIIAQGINATLYGGQLTCLLGKNGAGKSTLLRTLSAFIPPLEGDVLIEGKILAYCLKQHQPMPRRTLTTFEKSIFPTEWTEKNILDFFEKSIDI